MAASNRDLTKVAYVRRVYFSHVLRSLEINRDWPQFNVRAEGLRGLLGCSSSSQHSCASGSTKDRSGERCLNGSLNQWLLLASPQPHLRGKEAGHFKKVYFPCCTSLSPITRGKEGESGYWVWNKQFLSLLTITNSVVWENRNPTLL